MKVRHLAWSTICCLLVSISISAKEKSITNVIYSEKGLAGKQIMTQLSDSKYKGSLDLRWNNRVFKIDEQVTVNDKGFIAKYKSTGLSPFGAPINESFKYEDGYGVWESNKEDGRLKSKDTALYLPANSAVVAENLMVQAMLKSMSNSVDLLPSGNARLTKLKTVTLSNDAGSTEVHLYAINGLGFSPDFSWYDSEGNFFSKDISGFFKVIREGYSVADFDKLKGIQNNAEQEYLESVASKNSHAYSSILFNNANVVDVINEKVLKSTDVLVQEGKIVKIAKSIKAPKKSKVVDASGKTLIPGLWDMHGHLSKDDGMLNIAAGVTNVRDIGNSHDNIMDIERLFNSNTIIGNRVFRAGFFDQMSEYSAGLSVSSLEEAHEKVDWFADNGYIQIKLYSSIDPSWVKPIYMRLPGKLPKTPPTI